MMSKKLYRELCAKENSIPVFSRDWWLDAACDGAWTVLMPEKKGCASAAMPLYVPCKGVITMPDYTQTMGIWFAAGAEDAKPLSVLAHRQAACKSFVEQLGRYRSFLQNFSHGFTDWLPFYWAGYTQTTRYTYILPDIGNAGNVLSGMSRQTRRNIKKAEEQQITVHRGIDTDDFLKIQSLTFERQHRRNTQSPVVLRRLINAARERKQGDLFGGADRDGNLHAVAFVVWQDSSAYYIAGGGDPAFRSSGAHSFVLWEAIRYVSQYAGQFDFEGSMLPGVERFFREFGAVQTPYFRICRGKQTLLDRIRIKLKAK
ncbi:MAG: GNAT family N-acetyltransferase [Tannerella sp.]|jgi:hypothetical protein|nr:GNAT family N-acetyltransferase [Tannerella sp.]